MVDEKVYTSTYRDSLKTVQQQFDEASLRQKLYATKYVETLHANKNIASSYKDSLQKANVQINVLRAQYKEILKKADGTTDTNDTNYIFIRYVVDNLPRGVVGLLIAVIFLASWGSLAAALNSLASCTMIDFYCRIKEHNPHVKVSDLQEAHHYRLSKWFTSVSYTHLTLPTILRV